MRKNIRIFFFGATGLALIVAIGIALAVIIIDPNEYKSKIESSFLKATGRQLVLQGDISLSFFPQLGLKLGPAAIKGDASFSPDPFARIEAISVAFPLLPLLQGKMEIASATATGLQLNLIINERGKANWTTPQPENTSRKQGGTNASSGSSDLPTFALNFLSIRDAVITHTDMRTRQSANVVIPSLTLSALGVGQTTTLEAEVSHSGLLPHPAVMTLYAQFVMPPTLGASIPFELKGKLDNTTFSSKGTAAGPDPAQERLFSLQGNIDLVDIDLDNYLTAQQSIEKDSDKKLPAQKTPANKGADSAPKNDDAVAAILRGLVLDLRVMAQTVTVAKLPISDIRLQLTADNGLLIAKPVTARIGGGPVTLEFIVDSRGKAIQVSTSGDWKKARVAELARALSGKAPLAGELDTSWTLTMTGLSWPDAANTLEGEGTVVLKNGSLPQFPLIPANIPGLPAKIVNLSNVQASGTWTAAKGIATNNDLAVSTTDLRASGNGHVNIPAQSLHYTVTVELPTLPELPNLTVLPVVISGPLASPTYSIDQPSLLRNTAKTILNPTTKSGKEIQRGLNNLFKR